MKKNILNSVKNLIEKASKASKVFAVEKAEKAVSCSVKGQPAGLVESAITFDSICTIMQFLQCRDIVKASRLQGNENGNIYSLQDTEKAKALLSQLRKDNKSQYDNWILIQQASEKKTDTAKVVISQAQYVTIDVQGNIKARALGALNYAIKKYNSNNIVTIGEIKQAFESLEDSAIYKYYSVSTMQFNARALLAKCVNTAVSSKVKAEKAKVKASKAEKDETAVK